MTVAEFVARVERGEESHADVIIHLKKGDFTPTEFEAFMSAKDGPAYDERVAAFYQGNLFRAQRQDFENFCNGVDAHHDRRRAYDFLDLARKMNRPIPEIQDFIRQIVNFPRVKMEKLDKDPTNRNRVSTEWTRRIEAGGWRHWPKNPPTKESAP